MAENRRYRRIAMATARALVDQCAEDVAVYLPKLSGESPVLYSQGGAGISKPDFERLQTNGVSHLYDSVEFHDKAVSTAGANAYISRLFRSDEPQNVWPHLWQSRHKPNHRHIGGYKHST